ncbi:MAG TPA: S16 family serine protease [Pseudonocardiaceae bacterium]|nr:S16 family serine protease [Pseudonocardiaceae bacterium]
MSEHGDAETDQPDEAAEEKADEKSAAMPAESVDAVDDTAAEDTAADGTPAEPAAEPPRQRRGPLSRRAWTLIVSLVLVLALGGIGGFVQIPYVALGPGPTFDTLGSVDGAQVVSVSGHQTYPTAGQLRMVTVSLTDQVTLFGALGLWMSGRYALAPREDYYQPGESQQQVEQQNTQQFQQSQSNAEVAALRYLRYPVQVLAAQIVSDSPAARLIQAGDQLITVNGQQINSVEDVYNALTNTTPGQPVGLTVRTGDQPQRSFQVKLGSRSDRRNGFLGVSPAANAVAPFKVNIELDNVGGPSAGLMFALAIVDKLTKDNVNDGLTVAGTGEIDDLGDVSQIGGIPFKLIAAREAGATVFLTPADNCAEAASHVPAGLRLVKVTTLTSAIQELHALAAGQPVPGC